TYQMTTGVNQITSSMSHFAVVDNTTAQTGTIGQIPFGTLAKSTETTYHSSATYRNANILGVTTGSIIRNGYAPFAVVSKSTMTYDECPTYCVTSGRALPTTLKTW